MKRKFSTTGVFIASIITALVVTSGGVAVAAGLITTSDIKNGAVTSAKVKNGSLLLKDFKASERSKLVGPRGATGATGATGPMGAIGPASASASANSVVVQSSPVTVAAFDIGTVIAFCPAGKKVTGGGYF